MDKNKFRFEIKERKGGGRIWQTLFVYEKNFPFMLCQIPIKDNKSITELQTNFILQESQKTEGQRTFDKLFILFEQRREIEYATYLRCARELHENYGFSLDEDMDRLSQIYGLINFYITQISKSLPSFIARRYSLMNEPTDSTILLMIEIYHQQFLTLQNKFMSN